MTESTPTTPTQTRPPSKTPNKVAPQKRRPGGMILAVIVVLVLGLFIWSEMRRRNTAQELEQTVRQLEEIQASSQQSGDEVADEILVSVSALVDIPLDPRPAVAKIDDIERLTEANEFFGVADNGDYLILTGNRAILYDPDRDIVLDVAPFRINQESPSLTETPAATDQPE